MLLLLAFFAAFFFDFALFLPLFLAMFCVGWCRPWCVLGTRFQTGLSFSDDLVKLLLRRLVEGSGSVCSASGRPWTSKRLYLSPRSARMFPPERIDEHTSSLGSERLQCIDPRELSHDCPVC